MNRFLYLACICLGLSMASCSNEEGNYLEQSQQIVDAKQFLTVTYEGKTYDNIPVEYDKNGDLIFLDDVFSKIYNREIVNHDYTLLLGSNSHITFYHSLNELLQDQGISLIEDTETRSDYSTYEILIPTLGGVEMWDDKGYSDTYKVFTLSNSTVSTSVSNLNADAYKFNDKCSSLKVTNNLPNDSEQTISFSGYTYKCSDTIVVFIGYDDNTFADNKVVCVAEPCTICSHSSLPNFNDKISSFKVGFAYKTQYTENMTPHK